MRDIFLPYGHQLVDDDDIKSVIGVLKSDFITQGSKVEEFEKLVAGYCGCRYAVAFSSGTGALFGALNVCDIGGRDVITSPLSFCATANSVLYNDGNVVFADIKQDTFNIDINMVRKKLTEYTKVLLCVDFAGQPCDIDEINEFAGDNGLVVVEDACHSLGASYRGRRVGGLCDMSVFSFHPVKSITTGEGGMVLTNNQEFYEKLRLFRSHGIIRGIDDTRSWYYEIKDLGFNFRITDIQCALGISQFKKLSKFIDRRRMIAKMYDEAFRDLDGIGVPFVKSDVKSAYHLYVIRLDKYRNRVFNLLNSWNIGVMVHYIPIYRHLLYQHFFNYDCGWFPVTESFYDGCLSLPLFPGMSDEDVEDVVFYVKKAVKEVK